MIVLFDSWAWLEYAFKTETGKRVREIYENKDNEIITTKINIYEVYAKVLKELGQKKAETIIQKIMNNSKTVELDIETIKMASELKVTRGFGMADSIILASAIKHKAKLVTGDKDFEKVKDIKVEILK